jgi:hypothetical protein
MTFGYTKINIDVLNLPRLVSTVLTSDVPDGPSNLNDIHAWGPRIDLTSHIETSFPFINIDTQVFNVRILRESRRPIVHDPGEYLVYREMVHAIPIYQLV